MDKKETLNQATSDHAPNYLQPKKLFRSMCGILKEEAMSTKNRENLPISDIICDPTTERRNHGLKLVELFQPELELNASLLNEPHNRLLLDSLKGLFNSLLNNMRTAEPYQTY
ncbi:hypothetical protein PHYBLDRAFT_68587 [Phycomyces blakesleeanus NRRL 1555(-)]|uniref:Uncharacterized protein n=1 Tax=Phycomyces blakesleeanus (strain ATCC 8743b / DSM 1359 / FGSC 10004 / NBRC 33097 / NRRL 1555) TaxID=763407 RepID=A0A167PH75_PHYB8|nr:hypothetical protein PHYBLDRAFT_68587 [Phycomyces blakesleeanus NRRL 1555(-)]OAD77909.1 hypothetical protein PHYBLDRAFT_68587 [Phycomyces blakesleeanus NRRL 1555(-)]|eukprot:XP_018295949.1 hypothetical protein PHYBLDRAFT_68587 [Phycomyces blakesleeanus NRRL 1555(-)]